MSGGVRRRRVLRSISATGLGLVALAGCTAGGSGNGPRTVDATDDLRFEPRTVTVSTGESVVWRNPGSVGHTVTAYDDRIPDGAGYFASGGFEGETAARNAFPEGSIDGGERYEHTFEVAGTYEYFCVPHEGSGMTGTVRVE